MSITPSAKIWMNGNLVDWDAAQVHVLTHTLHYGTGVYEGLRAYETPEGPAVFRLTDHIARLHESARILLMELPYSVAELVEATKLVVRDSGLSTCYIRPIAYYGYGEMGLDTKGSPVDVAIACWQMGVPLGDHGMTTGMRLKVSSWLRHDHNTMPPVAKTTGNYVNSSLARTEARNAGYDDAVLLNRHGTVAECTGANLLCVRDGQLITPPTTAGALDGITRRTVLALCRDLDIDVTIGDLTRSDLYLADELILCGTGAEINGVNSVDDRPIPCPGPLTQTIAEEYRRTVHGQNPTHKDWNEPVGKPTT